MKNLSPVVNKKMIFPFSWQSINLLYELVAGAGFWIFFPNFFLSIFTSKIRAIFHYFFRKKTFL